MTPQDIDYEELKKVVDIKLHVVGQNTRSPGSIKLAIAEYLAENKIIEIQKYDGCSYVDKGRDSEALSKVFIIYCELFYG